jgi:outer membrane PBP1 activator LpoA protein
VAERAWLDGHQRALVLTPIGEWGSRIGQHFRQRYEALGGRVLEIQRYNPSENDFSTPIRLLLNTDESDVRTQSLKRLLGMQVETEARRRQDADFIFLAARPKQGRQLGPQLKFHHAGGLPIYATSHIYSGVADNERDRDLGQIRFVDTPWLLEEQQKGELSRSRLQHLMSGVKGQYARLYAMGIDSYNLLANLELLQQPGRTFSGKSGTLYLDRHNRLHRLLAWADMAQGKASIIGYAPRMHAPMLQPEQAMAVDPLDPVSDQPAMPQPVSGAVRPDEQTPGTQ